MSDADKRIRKLAKAESQDIPKEVDDAIKTTLEQLPEKQRTKNFEKVRRRRVWSRAAIAFAAAIGIFIALPNISPEIAYAMKSIPVIGAVAEVITFRDYYYSDNFHDAKAEVPEIQVIPNSDDDKLYDSAGKINEEVKKLTGELIDRFKQDVSEIGSEGHTSLSIKYDVVTNDDKWFTLKIEVYEGAGSSNTYYKYYHIDKQTGDIIVLSDMFQDDAFQDAIAQDILRQMHEQVSEDKDKIYWQLDYPKFSDFEVDDTVNFYFRGENIVIVFDKYEAGPGYMGCPEFEIEKSVYEKYLKDQYR